MSWDDYNRSEIENTLNSLWSSRKLTERELNLWEKRFGSVSAHKIVTLLEKVAENQSTRRRPTLKQISDMLKEDRAESEPRFTICPWCEGRQIAKARLYLVSASEADELRIPQSMLRETLRHDRLAVLPELAREMGLSALEVIFRCGRCAAAKAVKMTLSGHAVRLGRFIEFLPGYETVARRCREPDPPAASEEITFGEFLRRARDAQIDIPGEVARFLASILKAHCLKTGTIHVS